MEEQTVPSVDPTSTPPQVVPPVVSVPTNSTPVPSAPATPTPAVSQPVQAKSHRLAYILLGIGVLVIVGLVAVLLLRPKTAEAPPESTPLITEQTQPTPEPTPISGGVLQTILAENCTAEARHDRFEFSYGVQESIYNAYTVPISALPISLSQEWQTKYGPITHAKCIGAATESTNTDDIAVYDSNPETFRAELGIGPADEYENYQTNLAVFHWNSSYSDWLPQFEITYLLKFNDGKTRCSTEPLAFYQRCFQNIEPGFDLIIAGGEPAGLSTVGLTILLSKGKISTDQSMFARAYAYLDVDIDQHPTLLEVFKKYGEAETVEYQNAPPRLVYTVRYTESAEPSSVQPFYDEFKNALIQLPVYQNARDTINETMDAFEFKE